MSLQESTVLPVRASKQEVAHPLAPLSAQEIKAASSLIQNQWPENTDLQFKVVTLEEPAKVEMVPFLEAEFKGENVSAIDRRVMCVYYIRKTVRSIVLHDPDLHIDMLGRTNFMRPLST
jgi:primary-amine oxidase